MTITIDDVVERNSETGSIDFDSPFMIDFFVPPTIRNPDDIYPLYRTFEEDCRDYFVSLSSDPKVRRFWYKIQTSGIMKRQEFNKYFSNLHEEVQQEEIMKWMRGFPAWIDKIYKRASEALKVLEVWKKYCQLEEYSKDTSQ